MLHQRRQHGFTTHDMLAAFNKPRRVGSDCPSLRIPLHLPPNTYTADGVVERTASDDRKAWSLLNTAAYIMGGRGFRQFSTKSGPGESERGAVKREVRRATAEVVRCQQRLDPKSVHFVGHEARRRKRSVGKAVEAAKEELQAAFEWLGILRSRGAAALA